jgi:predicted DNA-binding WGR domain protein
MGGVYGADDLFDYLNESADRKKKDFDIRKMVKECLQYQTWWYENNIGIADGLKVNLNAFNIVRESIGEKPFAKGCLTPGQKTFRILQETLTAEKIRILSSEYLYLKRGRKWNISESIPNAFSAKSINYGRFTLSTSKNVRKILAELPFVRKVIVRKMRKNEKAVSVFFLKAGKSHLTERRTVQPAQPKKRTTVGEIKLRGVMCTKKDGTSDKFWQATIQDSTVTVRFGRAGTKGRESVKVFEEEDEAWEYYFNKIGEKKKKGYRIRRL